MNGANAKRNPILVKALDKMEYIENYTSGIQRILGEYSDFPIKPEFYITDALFKVTLYNKNYFYDREKAQAANYSSTDAPSPATVNATAKEILDLMKRDRNITLSQLAEITSKHRVTIARNIKALREAGLIERVGSDKSGYWQIL